MRSLILLVSLALCGSCIPRDPPRPGTLLRDQAFDHDGVARRYHFYEAVAPGPRPLVVLLHGGGGDIDNHIGLDAARWPHQVWLDIADEEGLDLVIPQGISAHWHDCRAECTRCGQADDVGFLLGLIDDLSAHHAIDTQRVYAVGESNGGFMAQRLAQEVPERFAGIGVVIALLPADTTCTLRDLPMTIQYQVGTADAAVAYEGGANEPQISVRSARDTVAYWREVNGCEATPTTTTLEDLDTGDGGVVVREDYACSKAPLTLMTMEGGGHVAPSITVRVSSIWEGIAGVQNHDVEGARAFWAFFTQAR